MSNGERCLDDAVRKWPTSTLVELRIDCKHDLFVPLGHQIYMRERHVIEVLRVWSAEDLRFHPLSRYPRFWRDARRWWDKALRWQC
jgi:hypothetical protein